MFGLSWFLVIFFIGDKFEMRSGYAGIDDVNFSKANLKNLEEKTPNYQLALLNNADGNASKKKLSKFLELKNPYPKI
jgi:hypothetical protein